MTESKDPQAIAEAFAVRVAELEDRLRRVLEERAAAQRDVAAAEANLKQCEARLTEICAQEGRLRGHVADLERALKEARRLPR